jgi:hypothetical protein
MRCSGRLRSMSGCAGRTENVSMPEPIPEKTALSQNFAWYWRARCLAHLNTPASGGWLITIRRIRRRIRFVPHLMLTILPLQASRVLAPDCFGEGEQWHCGAAAAPALPGRTS